jgi:TolA-binding protein
MGIDGEEGTKMTNSEGTSNGDRLDRMEAILLSVVEQVAENTVAIRDTNQQVRQAMLAVERLSNAQMELARAFDEDRQRFEQFQTRFEQTQASTNAALERIDRIMDYLMRRDGERGAEG